MDSSNIMIYYILISFYLSKASEVYVSAFSLRILSCTSLAPVPVEESIYRLESVTVTIVVENGSCLSHISVVLSNCATVITQFMGEFVAHSSSSDKVPFA